MANHISEALEQKLKQGSFFLRKLIATRDAPFEFNAYFAAYLSSVRSVAFYVRHSLEERRGRNLTKTEWKDLMESWEATLSDDQRTGWRVLTRYRDRDTHEDPVIPGVGVVLSSAGWYKDATGAAELPGKMRHSTMIQLLHDTDTGKHMGPIEVCRLSLEVARRLLSDHQKFTI